MVGKLHTVNFGVRIQKDLGRLEPPCGHTTRLVSLGYFVLPQRVVRWVRVWVINRSSFGIFERGWDWLTRIVADAPKRLITTISLHTGVVAGLLHAATKVALDVF